MSFCTVKLWFLYSTVSTLKSIVSMVLITSPSFSSYCPCWTPVSVLGLQLSSVMCFPSYFALSQSQSFNSLCLLLALLFSVLFSLLQIFDVLFARSSYSFCFTSFFSSLILSPLALWLWFRLCFFFRVCGSSRLRGSFLASSQHHYSALRHFVIVGSRCPRSKGR